MKSVSKEIRDHLGRHQDIFVNHLGVETELRVSGYVFVGSQWPGAVSNDPDYVLEIYAEEESIDSLVTMAGIYTFQQFLDLSPTRLLDLYHEGKAIVACAIDREDLYYEIDFIKTNNHVWAVDEDDDACLLAVPPETPEEFLRYLREYARMNSII